MKFKTITDSIFSADNTEKLNELTANAEAQQKEVEQAKLKTIALEENKQQQRIVLILVFCILLLVSCFLVFVIRLLRISNKKTHIIEMQKKVIEQKQEETEASIRHAAHIQKALLPSEWYIENALNKLKDNN